MQGQMPQEIEVWYIIPALRRELAKSLKLGYNLTQKEVSKKMGITEAAVSQYLHSKRGKEVVFSKAIQIEVNISAKKIISDSKLLIPEMIRLSKLTQVKKVMCDMHKKHDIDLPKECDICFDDQLVKIPVG